MKESMNKYGLDRINDNLLVPGTIFNVGDVVCVLDQNGEYAFGTEEQFEELTPEYLDHVEWFVIEFNEEAESSLDDA